MKYIKLYEDWHVMPDGNMKETYCEPHDVVFNIFNWLDKVEEKEPDFEAVIRRIRKDLDRGNLDPHDLIEANKLFFTEDEVIDYLLDSILEYYNKKRSE
jgi:hypothetical protein